MIVRFIKCRQGYAYFAGDKADLPEDVAMELMKEGVVMPDENTDEESDLPMDLPLRSVLIKNGLSMRDQVLAARAALVDIKGIGEKTAKEIIEILEKL